MSFKSLTITNFKSFEGKQKIPLSKGINYIVGNNNCGKSTIVDALRYLAEGTRDTSALQNKSTSEDFSVEAIIAGEDLSQIVEDRKYSKLKDYLLLNEDGHYFKVAAHQKKRRLSRTAKK